MFVTFFRKTAPTCNVFFLYYCSLYVAHISHYNVLTDFDIVAIKNCIHLYHLSFIQYIKGFGVRKFF